MKEDFYNMRDVTELVIIIDKSGSMNSLKEDVIGGFNNLINEQKKEGNTLVTFVTFNHDVNFVKKLMIIFKKILAFAFAFRC